MSATKQMATKTWRKVKTVEELVHIASLGLRVKSDSTSILEHPRKADAVMGFSSRFLIKIITEGLFYEGDSGGDGAGDMTILGGAQSAIRATGLSTTEIASRVGVSRQAVAKFLCAKSVQTRILEKYLVALKIKAG